MFLWVKDVKKARCPRVGVLLRPEKRKKTVFQGGFLSGHKVTKRRVFWCALLWTEGERRKGYLRAGFFSGQRSLRTGLSLNDWSTFLFSRLFEFACICKCFGWRQSWRLFWDTFSHGGLRAQYLQFSCGSLRATAWTQTCALNFSIRPGGNRDRIFCLVHRHCGIFHCCGITVSNRLCNHCVFEFVRGCGCLQVFMWVRGVCRCVWVCGCVLGVGAWGCVRWCGCVCGGGGGERGEQNSRQKKAATTHNMTSADKQRWRVWETTTIQNVQLSSWH